MLTAPLPQQRRRAARSRTDRTQTIATLSDEQEAAGFMAFLGEHRQFASTHQGA